MMNKKILVLLTQIGFSQNKLPVIKATSDLVLLPFK